MSTPPGAGTFVMDYPTALMEIVDLFEALPEEERRENLIAYADGAPLCAPRADEEYALVDERKDEECTDRVGVFLRLDGEGRAHFRVKLGAQVQTLTRAMAAILCRGFEGCRPSEVLEVPGDFVPRIVGGELVRVRSQTVYYVLSRFKGICRLATTRGLR